ncbi:apolipoprotein N-acyltransferase [Neorickettsia sp. 179522]|uniref:apolipoprotein N-acyltransferase n=1 Tax=Neorickettsia sp. 179522 TaxID=1714371 RepID=UPI000797EE5D|nr:apolipoprotein N-acyltransferase [Neorickettsia sp. 179522]KYH12549.1 acyltransferase [Neorickettsia sp. 179522]
MKVSEKYLPILLGVCMTLGFAPFHLTFVLIFALALVYKQLRLSSSIRKTFLFSIYFGSAFFLTSLYWIAFALATDIQNLWWLIIPVPIVLSIFLSLYFTCAFILFKAIKIQNPLTFSLIITGSEYLREVCFSGFPWNLIGYSWDHIEFLQLASLFGIFGLTAFTTFLSGSIGELLFKDSKKARIYFTCSIILFISVFCFGLRRLSTYPTQYSSKIVRIVQANISHQQVWTTEFQKMILKKYIQLSISRPSTKITYFVWPESSLPFLFSRPETDITLYVSQVLGKPLIAAGTRRDNNSLFNSIFVLRNGVIAEYYDKVKLIPFGEYVPLENIIPIKKIVNGMSSFTPGHDNTKVLDSIEAAPILCYESIFSTFIARKKPAEWIVNLTNDSWFGNSTARYQHLQMARIRAIEYGLPLIRSTTTGISAVIDPYGRILEKIDYSSEGVLDIAIPKKHPKKTLYSTLVHSLTGFCS